MALVFPSSPSVGQRYPVNPGTSGVTQYVYTGTTWDVVLPVVSLGAANQAAYNNYTWPLVDGTSGRQLTTDGAGSLTWGVSAVPSFQPLSATPAFDGVTTNFTLVRYGGTTTYTPSPSGNVLVFLDGLIRPVTDYLVLGSNISFTTAPALGVIFYAVSVIVA